MLNKVLILLSITLALCAETIPTDSNNKTKMIEAFRTIREILEVQYAPLEWKESHLNWNLLKEIQLVEEKINSTSNIKVKHFQHYLKNFFLSLQDFHLNVSFYSTEAAILPLTIKSADGHYFITRVIQYAPLNSILKNLKPGDEIISFNGVPIDNAVQEFLDQEFHHGISATDRAMGEYFFFSREGAYGHLIPKGKVVLEVKHQSTNKRVKYNLEWIYIPEKIPHIDLPKAKTARACLLKEIESTEVFTPLNQHEMLKKSMHAPLARHLYAEGELGDKKSFLPSLGKVIWESSEHLEIYAYIFQSATNRKIGYIRIPHYSLSPNACMQIENILAKFSKETEALVIDQTNNHGGLVFQMYYLTSMLINKPFVLPYHRISLTQKEIAFAINAIPALQQVKTLQDAYEIVGHDLEGYPITLEIAHNLLKYFQDMVSEWHSGNQITKPLPLWGIQKIDPHPTIRYDKPVLVLINELDFSCADLFPAIMQDNKRAKLFGSTTAGAGGFVLGMEFPNLLGVETITYTGSIAERPDSSLIENLGVTPDVSYQITADDLTHSYHSYIHAVNQMIENLFY